MAELPEKSSAEQAVPRPTLVDGIRAVVRTIDPPLGTLRDWITEAAGKLPLDWYFSTHDDGVIWGRFDSSGNGARSLRTASDVLWNGVNDGEEPEPWVPKLRIETLWELWLFGPDAAVHVWREGDGFSAVQVVETDTHEDDGTGARVVFEPREGAEDEAVAVDEWALLWGTHARPLNGHSSNGFAHVADASAVVEHVLPIERELETKEEHRLREHVYERRRGYRVPLDPGDPDTHLGLPVLWRPCELAVRTPFNPDLS